MANNLQLGAIKVGGNQTNKRPLTEMTANVELIDVAAYKAQGIPVPIGKNYLVTINGDPYVFDQIHVKRIDVLNRIKVTNPDSYVVYQIIDDADIEVIDADEVVNLANPGFERFVVKESTIYNYIVDNDPETSDKKVLTANQILERAAYRPAEYYLVELQEGGQQISYVDRPNDPITLTHQPKKKFISIYRGNMPVS